MTLPLVAVELISGDIPVHLRSMAVRWEGSSTKMEQGEPEIERNRASFSRWEKRSVISNHFTELKEITEKRMFMSLTGDKPSCYFTEE